MKIIEQNKFNLNEEYYYKVYEFGVQWMNACVTC